MTTRAASATLSLRAKQDLVRVLFGAELSKIGPQAHRLLDHSIYSYADLRSSYLERVQKLHPDKQQSQQSALELPPRVDEGEHAGKRNVTKTDSSHFLKLQEAWNRYESVAKFSKQFEKADSSGLEAHFTMFGVGCSFSDNDDEREMRAKIMDQASRGWFSAGELYHTDNDDGAKANDASDHAANIPLVCDDLFEIRDDTIYNNDAYRNQSDTVDSTNRVQRSLVSHLIPPHRRRLHKPDSVP
jgi:hypothetical protein